MLQTPNYGLKKPELNDTPDITQLNQNWDTIDQKLKEAHDAAVSSIGAGEDNKSTQEIKTLLVSTDTRSITVTRDTGLITGLTIIDPTDDSTVATLAVTREGGQISQIVKSVDTRQITTTIARTNGQITGISKAVS